MPVEVGDAVAVVLVVCDVVGVVVGVCAGVVVVVSVVVPVVLAVDVGVVDPVDVCVVARDDVRDVVGGGCWGLRASRRGARCGCGRA